MKLLAIETATEACSAALFLDGKVVERFEVAPRRHTELILPMVESLLSEAGLDLKSLDALAFGRGPGAFTGVRIAAGVVQGLAFGAELPVVPVSTLAALALEAFDEHDGQYALVALDARMGEVYWAVYRRGMAMADRPESDLVLLQGIEQVAEPEKVIFSQADEGGSIGVGPGWKAYEAVFRQRFGEAVREVLPNRLPRAGLVARLAAWQLDHGGAVVPEQAIPVYLRNQVARAQSG